MNIIDDDIIVFDCMGRGEVPCICNANVPKSAPIVFKRRLNNLEQKVSGLISNITKEKCYKINSNYSDNASFLANGIPAVCITMLPNVELYEYVNLNKIPFIKVMPSQANYFFIEVLPPHNPIDLCSKLLKGYNILASACLAKKGIAPNRYMRIAVRNHTDNARFIKALKEIIK